MKARLIVIAARTLGIGAFAVTAVLSLPVLALVLVSCAATSGYDSIAERLDARKHQRDYRGYP